MTPDTLFAADPITTGWLIIITLLLTVTVAVPILRALAAGVLLLIAALTGRAQLRGTAARVMPRIGHLIGSLVIGTAAIASPALAAGQTGPGTLDAIDLDRDAGASRAPSSTQPETAPSSTPAQTSWPAPVTPDMRDTEATPRHDDATPSAHNTTAVPAPAAEAMYTVRSGDTLWDIAADALGEATDREITETWKAIWRANRDVIGADPGLILPGQQLDLSGAGA